MIPDYIPRVGMKVRFGDVYSKPYTVKGISESVKWNGEKYVGVGEGVVCVIDENNCEYILPFEKFKAKE